MRKFSLTEDASYPGTFWFPGHSSEYFSGYLNYSVADGLSLQVFDDKNEILNFDDLPFDIHTTLHGYLIGKGPVTVSQIAGVKQSYGFYLEEFPETKNISHLTLKPLYAFTGYHFDDVENTYFKHLSIHGTLFDFWFERFEPIYTTNPNTGEHSMGYKPLEDIKVWVDSLNSHIVFRTHGSLPRKGFGKNTTSYTPNAMLTHSDWISIHPESPQPIRWYLQQFHKLKLFIMLFIHKRVFYKNIWGQVETHHSTDSEIVASVIFKQQDLFEDEGLYPEDLMLRLNKMTTLIAPILNSFFNSYENGMEEIYKLFLAEYFHPRTNLTNRFLNLCQALESYHARNHKQGKILNPDQFKQNYKEPIKALLKQIEIPDVDSKILEDINSKIIQSIGFANGPNLAIRLQQLLETIDYEELGITDSQAFANRVAKTRNYYTHYSVSKYILDDLEIDIAHCQLKLILICLMYRDLGIPKELYFRHLQCSAPYQRVALNPHLTVKPTEEVRTR